MIFISEKRKTVSIIGVGRVGEHVASILALKDLYDIRLFDLADKGSLTNKLLESKSIDISHLASSCGSDVDIGAYAVTSDGKGYEALEGSSVVVISAGMARQKGMSRKDLLECNACIVRNLSENIRKYAPDSVIVVVTNPVDVITYIALKESGFPESRVIGSGSCLDTSRLRFELSKELGMPPGNIDCMVVGSHDDYMVPMLSLAKAGRKPITKILTAEKIATVSARAIGSGSKIVSLSGTSAYHAPASAAVRIIEAVLLDLKETLPCSVFLSGSSAEHYGASGICIGVPSVIGAGGCEKVLHIDFSADEWSAWKMSVEHLSESIREISLIMIKD